MKSDIIKTKQEIMKASKTKHNYKLTQEDIKDIMLYYYLDNTKQTRQEILNKYNISKEYYYRLVKNENNKKLIEKDINEKRQMFTKKSEIIIDKALNTINKNIDSGDINNKDLITITGILYDKTRLENNLSTSNNSININIKIE
jgi:5'-3' exonuclease